MADVLDKLLDLAILQHDPQCKWRLLIDRMNQLGAAGCRKHRAELIQRMAEFYGPREDLGDILEDSCKRAEIFEKHKRRQQAYCNAYEDHGERGGIREFTLDWRQTFKADPSAEVVERFKAIRREVYGKAAGCKSCGKPPHWITEETLATLTECKV